MTMIISLNSLNDFSKYLIIGLPLTLTIHLGMSLVKLLSLEPLPEASITSFILSFYKKFKYIFVYAFKAFVSLRMPHHS